MTRVPASSTSLSWIMPGLQPLASAVASLSTENRVAARIDAMTQACAAGVALCSALCRLR